jgi:hypothetical protein
MTSPRPALRGAQAWHLLTAAAVVIGLVWQLVLILNGTSVLLDEAGDPPAVATRVVRFFSYFTVESNILVAAMAITLARDPLRDGRVWRVLRIESLFGITVTGVIYSTILRGVVDLHGAAAVTNALLHYVAPVMAVVGWLLFGPRPRITEDVLMVSLLWPALYIAWVVVFGAITDWYPYPFTDVGLHGYPTVIRNGIGVIVLLVGVGSVFRWLDHRLAPRRQAEPL